MDSGSVLILTFLLIAALIVGGRYYLRKERIADCKSLPLDWEMLQRAVKYKDVEDIIIQIEKLVWNRCISLQELDEITQILDTMVREHPKYEELTSLTYNRKLNHSKDYITWG